MVSKPLIYKLFGRATTLLRGLMITMVVQLLVGMILQVIPKDPGVS